MLIEDISFEDITIEDIEALIGQKERSRLEYKRELESSDSSKTEILRDICAMANSNGGLIIIGVEEKNEKCVGFKNVNDADGMAQSIRQMLLDGVEERILDLQLKSFFLTSGEDVLVISVPSSFNKTSSSI